MAHFRRINFHHVAHFIMARSTMEIRPGKIRRRRLTYNRKFPRLRLRKISLPLGITLTNAARKPTLEMV